MLKLVLGIFIGFHTYWLTQALFFLRNDTLQLNFELNIQGYRVSESILLQQKQLQKLYDAINGTMKRLSQCDEQLSRIANVTAKRESYLADISERLHRLEFPLCFGKNSSDPMQCSGHGTCISADSCHCEDSWTNQNCDTIIMTSLQWETIDATPAPAGRRFHSASVHNDLMWIYGGHTGSQVNHFWAFNFTDFTWQDNTHLNFGNLMKHSSNVHQDCMYFVGGWNYRRNTRKFCFSSLEWIDLTGIPTGRNSHSGVIYGNSLVVMGGLIDNSLRENDVWGYDFSADVWDDLWDSVSGSAKPTIRDEHSAVRYGDGMYIFGGNNQTDSMNDLWRFDFLQGRWELISIQGGKIPSPRSLHSAVVYNDGMWVYGGTGASNPVYFWRFDFSASSWEEIAFDGIGARHGHTCVLYQDAFYLYGRSTSVLFRLPLDQF